MASKVFDKLGKGLAVVVSVALSVGVLAGLAGTVHAEEVKHVVLIGIDGWGAFSLEKAHDIPNIRYLMTNGCYTLKDRAVLPSSSAINWASMFMGAPTEMHGYTQWNSRTPEIPSACVGKQGIYPTVFEVIRDHLPQAETGCFYEWGGIAPLVGSNAISRVRQGVNDQVPAYIRERKPTFVAVCFDGVDHAGHTKGFGSPEYYAALSRVDRQIGAIRRAVAEAGMESNTVIIVTADHGGREKGHGGKTLQELEIPFVIWGANIKRGAVITDTMVQYDCPATIVELLGLKRPQCWRGLPAVRAFRESMNATGSTAK